MGSSLICLGLNMPFYTHKSLLFIVRFHFHCESKDWVRLAAQVHYILVDAVAGAYTKAS